MTVTNRPTGQEKKLSILKNLSVSEIPQKAKGDGGSAAQKRRAAPLADTARARKNSSTPVASDTTAEKVQLTKHPEKGATTNRNLAQGKEVML